MQASLQDTTSLLSTYLAWRTRETGTSEGPGGCGMPGLMLAVRCKATPRGGLLDMTRLLSSSLFIVSSSTSAFLNKCKACTDTAKSNFNTFIMT